MTIRKRLFILVVVLTVPLVLCAGWIIQSAYRDLARDGAKLASLPALDAIWTASVMQGGPVPDSVLAQYPTCAPEKPADTPTRKLAQANQLMNCIGERSGVRASRSQQASLAAELVSGQLSELVVRTSAVIRNSRKVSEKTELSHFDTMSVLVGAGQFKVLADRISGLTRSSAPEESEDNATPFAVAGKAFRQANGGLQGALSKVAAKVGQGADGTTLDLAPLLDRYQTFLSATNDLQQASAADLKTHLEAMVVRSKMRMWGFAGALGIVFALAIAVAWHFSKSILHCIHLLNATTRPLHNATTRPLHNATTRKKLPAHS